MIASYGEDTIAAFIAEPVAGATLGAAVPADDYWPAIAEVCRRHDVVLIADEVMTGFGRTGRWFGMDHWDIRPDILTAGKGTTQGTCRSGSPRRRAASTRRSRQVPDSSTGSPGPTTRSARPPGSLSSAS